MDLPARSLHVLQELHEVLGDAVRLQAGLPADGRAGGLPLVALYWVKSNQDILQHCLSWLSITWFPSWPIPLGLKMKINKSFSALQREDPLPNTSEKALFLSGVLGHPKHISPVRIWQNKESNRLKKTPMNKGCFNETFIETFIYGNWITFLL